MGTEYLCIYMPYRSGLIASELYQQDAGWIQVHNAVNDEDQQLRQILSRLLANHFGAILRPKGPVCLTAESRRLTQALYA